MTDRIKLLISNDDGIFALGVRTLANTLAAGYDVTVVCPSEERSASGHGLTIHQPIRAEMVDSIFDPEVKAWSCSGTPVDCVKLAFSAILKQKPDFVLAGINQGSNLGTDILYSGTVAAAMEGTIEGIPSIALSLAHYTSKEFQGAADFACTMLSQLTKNSLPEATLLNINVPPVSDAEIAGVAITRQGMRRYRENFQQRCDPRGRSYYWLAGEVIEEMEQPEDSLLPYSIPTDVQAVRDNYISVTPLQYNLTDVPTVKFLEEKKKSRSS